MLSLRASLPIAVLSLPLVFDLSASSPTAVLLDPLVLAFKASSPIATFSSPPAKLGIPSSTAPSVKEYKDRLPANEDDPVKIILQSKATKKYFKIFELEV